MNLPDVKDDTCLRCFADLVHLTSYCTVNLR